MAASCLPLLLLLLRLLLRRARDMVVSCGKHRYLYGVNVKWGGDGGNVKWGGGQVDITVQARSGVQPGRSRMNRSDTHHCAASSANFNLG